MEEKKKRKLQIVWKIVFLFIIAGILILQFVDFSSLGEAKDVRMITDSMIRFLGGLLFIFMLIHLDYGYLFRFKSVKNAGILILLASIVAINNFPIIAFLDGRTTLIDPVYRIFLFFLECLSVGFFEEIIFRGIILIYLIHRFSDKPQGVLYAIVISSVLFGMIHLLNLLGGASIMDTLLQIGYSTLVGMMWAVVYLKTKNIWLVMILHAMFNFFGQVMFYLGQVSRRYDIYTIIMTIGFAAITAHYAYKTYRQMDVKSLLSWKTA